MLRCERLPCCARSYVQYKCVDSRHIRYTPFVANYVRNSYVSFVENLKFKTTQTYFAFRETIRITSIHSIPDICSVAQPCRLGLLPSVSKHLVFIAIRMKKYEFSRNWLLNVTNQIGPSQLIWYSSHESICSLFYL